MEKTTTAAGGMQTRPPLRLAMGDGSAEIAAESNPATQYGVIPIQQVDAEGARWGYQVRKTYRTRDAAARAARMFRWMSYGDSRRFPVTEAAVVVVMPVRAS